VICSANNPNDLITGRCERPATWICQRMSLGYPSNELVPSVADAFCDVHLFANVIHGVTDTTLTVAGYRIFRVQHWEKAEEVRRLRG
jgi:hypothetical protein